MAPSPFTKLQIENQMTELDTHYRRARIALFTVSAKRIAKLRGEGNFLETVFINAQYVEHHLRMVLYGYASRRRILHLLGEKDIYEPSTPDLMKLDDDEKTLGALIGLLRRLNGNQVLLRRLESFNDLRKEAIHHIFDGVKEIEPFNEKIGEYFGNDGGEFTQICRELGEEQEKVRAEIKELARLAGVHSAGVEPAKPKQGT